MEESTAPHLGVVKQHLIFGPKGSGKCFFVKTQLAKQLLGLELSAQNVVLQSDFHVDDDIFTTVNTANLFCNSNWFATDHKTSDVYKKFENLFAWAKEPVYKFHQNVSVKIIVFEDTETLFSTDFSSGVIVSTVQQIHSIVESNQNSLLNNGTIAPTTFFLYPPFNIIPTIIQQTVEQIRISNSKKEQKNVTGTNWKHHIIYFLYTTSRPSCFPQELFDFQCGLPIYVPLPNFSERLSFVSTLLYEMANSIHKQLRLLGHVHATESSIVIQLLSRTANLVYNLANSAGASNQGEVEEKELQKMLHTIARLSKGAGYQKMVSFFESLSQRCTTSFLSTCNSPKSTDENGTTNSRNGLHLIVLEEGDIIIFTTAFFSSSKLFYHNEEVYKFAKMFGYKILPDELESSSMQQQQTKPSIRTMESENK